MVAPLHTQMSLFDHLSPFHILLDEGGKIQQMGPSLAKLCAHFGVTHDALEAQMTLSSQGHELTYQELAERAHRSIHCAFSGQFDMTFQGQSIPMPTGVFLDLGLTLEEVTRLETLPLGRTDFTPCMMIEEVMLLIEAKTIVLNASQDITLRLEHERNLALDTARRDPLTGLLNRAALEAFSDPTQGHIDDICVLQIDLDKFKAVNDTLGHAAGDHVLRHIAKILREETRRDDDLVRLGGDEFTIVLRNISDPSQAIAVAERIIRRAAEPIDYQGHPCEISTSIGVAYQNTQRPEPLEALIHQADAALYTAKRAGRNQWRSQSHPP